MRHFVQASSLVRTTGKCKFLFGFAVLFLLFNVSQPAWALVPPDESVLPDLQLTTQPLTVEGDGQLPGLSRSLFGGPGLIRLSLDTGNKLKFTGLLFLDQPSSMNQAVYQRMFQMTFTPGYQVGSGNSSGLPGFGQSDFSQASRAYSYQLGYDTSKMHLQAQFLEIGYSARALDSILRSSQPEEAEILKQALGTTQTKINGAWLLIPEMQFASSYSSHRNDKPGDDQRGLTITDSGHSLSLALGGSSKIEASIKEHGETWQPGLGKLDLHQHRRLVELMTDFGTSGRHGLRLALTNKQKKQGDTEESVSVREAHLNLTPTERLRLSADQTITTTAGQQTSIKRIGAVVNLAKESELSATITSVTPPNGISTRESAFNLTSKLAVGAARGQITAAQKILRASDGAMTKNLNSEISGSLGHGFGATNFWAKLTQQLGWRPTDPISKVSKLHLDRSLLPGLKVAVDRESAMTGTVAEPKTTTKSSYTVAADIGANTKVSTRIDASKNTGQATPRDGSAHAISIQHQVGQSVIQAEQKVSRDGAERCSASQYSIDVPTGKLPEWAENVSQAHAFPDAPEFILTKEPARMDIPFAGLRIWMKQYSGNPSPKPGTLNVAHRSVLADRYHLLASYQKYSEMENEGPGNPSLRSRLTLEVSAHMNSRLLARGRYYDETGLSDTGPRRRIIGLGVWGNISRYGQLEVSISRAFGYLDGAAQDRTGLALLYLRRVSDEHQFAIKLGYDLGAGASNSGQPDRKFDLRYQKPI